MCLAADHHRDGPPQSGGNFQEAGKQQADTSHGWHHANAHSHAAPNREITVFGLVPRVHPRVLQLPTLFTHCAQKTTPTNQLFPGPSARSAGPANQPPGPARVLPGSPTGQKFLRSAYSTRRTSKWVKMGYFTPLQAPRSIFSPLSILKLRHEGHSGLLDALGCQGKEPLRPLRRGRPLRECAKCGTNQPTSGGLECAKWGTTQPTQGPEWVNRVGSLVKPSGAGR